MDQNQIVNVLIAAELLADGERLVNLLRKAGLSLHAEAARDVASLHEQLQHKRWDLLLHVPGNPALKTAQVCSALDDKGLDLSLILVGKPGEDTPFIPGNLRTCAVCLIGDLQGPAHAEQFVRTVRHELDGLDARRTLRRTLTQLKELQLRYDLVLDSATDAIAYLHDGIHLHANSAYRNLFGFETVDALRHQAFLDLVEEQDVAQVRQALRQARGANSAPCQFTAMTANGTRARLQLDAMAATWDQQSALQIILSPATGNAPLQQQLRELRTLDIVTGLLNSSGLHVQIELAISQAVDEHSESVLAIARLEGFEDYLSLGGRSSANFALADATGILRQVSPTDALLAHCGLGEFAILLKGQGSDAQARLLQANAATLNIHMKAVLPAGANLLFTVGTTFINGLTPSADVALDRARHNLTVLENSSLAAALPDAPYGTPEQMFQRLEDAFRNEDFILVFQPVVSLKEDGLQRYEVRIRLQDNGTLIYPPRFLELANQHGLGEKIDRWVCTRSLRLLHERQNPALKLTLNLTHNAIVSELFLPWLQEQMLSMRVNAAQIILQISELDVVSSPEHVARFCSQLRELDIPLSVTHFGCTLSPGHYHALEDAEYVKLDKSLLLGIGQDQVLRERLNTTVKSLHARGLLVIAPMIDHIELLPLLWQASVNFVQGNCLQEPSARMDFSFVQDEEITMSSFH